MSTTNKKKILSFVLCGRNDDYLGDFKYRIATAINFLSRSAEKINRLNDIEIVVVDWNSDILLSDELNLSLQAVKITNFIIVPPDTAKKFNSPNMSFNSAYSSNIGIRRANGKFILAMGADILIPSFTLLNLFNLLEKKIDLNFNINKTMINIERKYIPWQIAEQKLTIEELENYLILHSRYLFHDLRLHGICGGYGALLMHKDIWNKCQGLFENYHYYGWLDYDLGLRINQLYPSIDLSYLGIYFYDLEQKQELLSTRNIPTSNSPNNNAKIHETINYKNKQWGLKDYNFKSIKSNFKNKKKVPIKKELNKINFNELKDKTLNLRVFKILKNNGIKLLKNSNYYCPLIWYIKIFSPNIFLDFNFTEGDEVFIVSNLAESIDIYAIDSFDKINYFNKYWNSLVKLNKKYNGFIRFISGNRFTAFERLKKSFIGKFSFDLVLFRIDYFQEKSLNQIFIIFKYLNDNGAIVIIGNNEIKFNNLSSTLKKYYKDYVYICCKKYKTIIIIKIKRNATEINSKFNEKVLIKAWKLNYLTNIKASNFAGFLRNIGFRPFFYIKKIKLIFKK